MGPAPSGDKGVSGHGHVEPMSFFCHCDAPSRALGNSLVNSPLVSVSRLLARDTARETLFPDPNANFAEPPILDQLRRPLRDLRLSVTDDCNFRCGYCMPRGTLSVLRPSPSRSLRLSFDELEQIAKTFVELGVNKLRLTGGEPLLRRDLSRLIERLSRLELSDFCLTTNGSLLTTQAPDLAAAGLHRITVSLDAIDEPTFEHMTDSHFSLSRVLDGIDAARAAGLGPVKINMVVRRGANEHSIVPMAEWARREGLELRFIEYMDVGRSNGWQRPDVVDADEIRAAIHAVWPVAPAETETLHGTAERYRYLDGAGFVGFIASISKPFCRDCSRARVSSTGQFYPCLFAPFGHDLALPLREGRSLRPLITSLWQNRSDRYSELRTILPTARPRPEMSAIGG